MTPARGVRDEDVERACSTSAFLLRLAEIAAQEHGLRTELAELLRRLLRRAVVAQVAEGDARARARRSEARLPCRFPASRPSRGRTCLERSFAERRRRLGERSVARDRLPAGP